MECSQDGVDGGQSVGQNRPRLYSCTVRKFTVVQLYRYTVVNLYSYIDLPFYSCTVDSYVVDILTDIQL